MIPGYFMFVQSAVSGGGCDLDWWIAFICVHVILWTLDVGKSGLTFKKMPCLVYLPALIRVICRSRLHGSLAVSPQDESILGPVVGCIISTCARDLLRVCPLVAP
jgi:hypothetical protein